MKYYSQLLPLMFLSGVTASTLQAAAPVAQYAGQVYQYLSQKDFSYLELLPIWSNIESWRSAIERLHALRVKGRGVTDSQVQAVIGRVEQARNSIEFELGFYSNLLEGWSPNDLKKLPNVMTAVEHLINQLAHDENRWNFRTSTRMTDFLSSVYAQLDEYHNLGHTTTLLEGQLTSTKDLI